MDLVDILSKDQILPDLRATNRWEAIDELIANLVATGKILPQNKDAVTAVVKKRESSMSTGIGFGIGIPHASTDLIEEVVGALGRSTQGVSFDALDNQPVKLVMLFLVPQGQFQKHLHTLANIAKLLHKSEFRQALENAPDAPSMLAVIRDQIGEREDRFFATVFFGSGLLFVALLFTTAAVVSTPATLVEFLGGAQLSTEGQAILRALGYTLLFALSSSFVALPEIAKDYPYDLVRDFVSIGFVCEQPMAIAVPPSIPGLNASTIASARSATAVSTRRQRSSTTPSDVAMI